MMRAFHPVVVLIAAFLLAFTPPSASASLLPDPDPVQSPFRTAPVTIDGTVLFAVRGLQAFPAQERASRIEKLIEKTARDRAVRADAIAVVESEISTDLVAEGETIMPVFDSDARPEGVRRQVLAQVYAGKVREAVARYRRDRSPAEIWRAVLWSAVATAGLLAGLFLLRSFFRRVQERLIEAKAAAKIGPIRIQSFVIVRAEQIRGFLAGSVRTVRRLVVLVLCYVYAHFVLSSFPWTRFLSNNLLDVLLLPLVTMARGFLKHIPDLVFLAVLAFVTDYLLRLMRLLFEGVENGTIAYPGFYPEWANQTYKIARFLVLAFMAVVAFPYIPGSDSPAFKGVSIFLGVLISLGSSSVIGNTLAGLTMTYRRAFRVGDRVKIGDFLGDVTEMRLLVTHLRSLKNEEIVVSNSVICNSQVVNFSSLSREHRLILHTSVTIGYNTPWRQVHELLLQAAARTQGLLATPAPFILQTSLDDFYVSYELNAYTDSPQAMVQVYSGLHQNIQDAFNEYGVQIMSPHYLLDPKAPAVVPRERWYAPPARAPGGGGLSERS